MRITDKMHMHANDADIIHYFLIICKKINNFASKLRCVGIVKKKDTLQRHGNTSDLED